MATFRIPESIRLIRQQNMNYQEYIYQLFLGILLGPAWPCGQLGTHWLCRNDAYRQHANAEDRSLPLGPLKSYIHVSMS